MRLKILGNIAWAGSRAGRQALPGVPERRKRHHRHPVTAGPAGPAIVPARGSARAVITLAETLVVIAAAAPAPASTVVAVPPAVPGARGDIVVGGPPRAPAGAPRVAGGSGLLRVLPGRPGVGARQLNRRGIFRRLNRLRGLRWIDWDRTRDGGWIRRGGLVRRATIAWRGTARGRLLRGGRCGRLARVILLRPVPGGCQHRVIGFGWSGRHPRWRRPSNRLRKVDAVEPDTCELRQRGTGSEADDGAGDDHGRPEHPSTAAAKPRRPLCARGPRR